MPQDMPPRDGIDWMLDIGRKVEQGLETGPVSPASQSALLKVRKARTLLTEARSDVERIRNRG